MLPIRHSILVADVNGLWMWNASHDRTEEAFDIGSLKLSGIKRMAGADKHISLWAPSGSRDLASMLHGVSSNATPLVQGQHTKNDIEEKMPDPGHVKAAKRTAHTDGKSPALEKRFRGANWGDEDKASLLVGKLKFLVTSMLHSLGLRTFKNGKTWPHYVSEELGRAEKSCQGQWDSLLKSRNAIDDHESKIKSGTSGHVSFWQMNELQKHTANEERRSDKLEPLPRVFQRAWYELIELIFQIESVKKNPGFKRVGGNLPSSPTAHISSTIIDSGNSPLGPSDAIRSQPSSSQDRGSMDPPLSMIRPQLGIQRAEDETVLGISDDCLISMIGPFVSKCVEDDLRTQVMPLLRGELEENNQKHHREKLLAIEEEKVDLKRKEMALLEDVLKPLIHLLRIREEEQRHKEKLLAIEEEKLALKRDKLAVKRESLALKREKMLHISCGTSSMPIAASSYPLNIKTILAPGQEPNYTQVPPNQDFSFPQDIPFLQDFSFSQDGTTSFQ